jgi:riboflavin kinase / FMN adenylyltransferase
LTSPAEKAEGLAAYPVKVVTLRFDMDLAAIPAESFVSDFLMGQLQGQAFLLGHDHRFGANARGDADLLRRIAGPTILVETTAPFKVAGELVSSSIIRAHLEAGRLAKATALLGRPFRYTGQVVAGAGRAKILGVPTANLDVGCKEKVRVASGVYFGEVQWDGQRHSAIANIGFAPTFGEGQHKIEVHIPGFSDNLYHQTLSFELSHRHRGEIRFADLDALKAQISKDLEAFKAHFSQITSQ